MMSTIDRLSGSSLAPFACSIRGSGIALPLFLERRKVKKSRSNIEKSLTMQLLLSSFFEPLSIPPLRFVPWKPLFCLHEKVKLVRSIHSTFCCHSVLRQRAVNCVMRIALSLCCNAFLTATGFLVFLSLPTNDIYLPHAIHSQLIK